MTDWMTSGVDLTNCDKEPIHIPGSIQPHGLLFALEEEQLTILQVSSNTLEILGVPAQKLLGQNLSVLLSEAQISEMRGCLEADFESVNPLSIAIASEDNTLTFDGIVHRGDGVVILELEPKTSPSDPNFFSFYRFIRGAIKKMQNASTLNELCQTLVGEVKKIAGFDRVMVYKFDSEGAGTVIAEAKPDDWEPFLGLWYPATDIPKQAKKLYALNLLRLIPDASYQPAPLVPLLNPVTQSPLDLSHSVLRSVSPLHIEYLHNMGVAASMSISLIKDKSLWGLIACHHQSPKSVNYEVRTACELLGQMMAFEIANKEKNEDLDDKINLKSVQSQFIEAFSEAEALREGLVGNSANLLALVNATGAVVCVDGEFTLVGSTPDTDQIKSLIDWLEAQISDNLFATNSLPKSYQAAEPFKDVASGVLALSISQAHKTYILWFRPEVIQTVNWAGNPNKPVEIDEDGEERLSPRKSFQLWQETVRLTALPWKACELEAALELRSAIIGIVLRKADELAKINIELARSNSELDSFAYVASHDLKEPLRGIHNYSSFLIEDYADILNEDGVSKLETLVRLTRRMEDLIDSLLHFSRLGRADLSLMPTDLNQVVKNVVDILKISWKDVEVDVRIPRPLPTNRCDRIQVNELFSNLIGNAIKYNNREHKWVEIGYLGGNNSSDTQIQANPKSALVFYVRDNGIGIRPKHQETIFRIFKRLHGPSKYGGGTGAGLTIAKKIVERHGGKIWVESTFGEGSTFYFTLSSGGV